MQDDLGRLKEVVVNIESIHFTDREDTILNIGGRGYYENPMSDILSFFIDTSASHNFGSLVLESLLLLAGRRDLDPTLEDKPIREAVGRIDIVLRGRDWVMALENKVRHGLNNPFEYYEECISNKFRNIPINNRLLCILSPYKSEINGWVWISTRELLRSLREKSGQLARTNNDQKWPILFREFLITLEQEVNMGIDRDAFEGLVQLYPDLVKAKNYCNEYITEIKTRVQYAARDLLKTDLGVSWHTWPDGIALRVFPNKTRDISSTLLVLNKETGAGERYRVQWYTDKKQTDPTPFRFLDSETVGGKLLWIYYKDYKLLGETEEIRAGTALHGFVDALTRITSL